MIKTCGNIVYEVIKLLVEKGKYVRIRNHLLKPEERDQKLPESTQKVPFKSWTKGYLISEAEMYEEATIITATNRKVTGILKEVEPRYKHSFGDFVSEIHELRKIILSEVWGDNDE